MGWEEQAYHPAGYDAHAMNPLNVQQQVGNGGGGVDPYLAGRAKLLKSLSDSYQSAYTTARGANIKLQNQISGAAPNGATGGYDNLYGRVMGSDGKDAQGRAVHNPGYIDQLGVQTRKNLGEQYDNLNAQVRQNAVDSGLSGTSALAGGLAQSERERSRSVGELNQNLAQQKITADTGITGQKLDWQNSITNAYPDYGQLQQTAQQAGEASLDALYPGYGGGGGVGGGMGGGYGPYSSFGPNPGMFGGGYGQMGGGMGGMSRTKAPGYVANVKANRTKMLAGNAQKYQPLVDAGYNPANIA